jgi:3,4-dihydroxy 2-butanone 4-phosphate synthase / GTP cyclohydrolase II
MPTLTLARAAPQPDFGRIATIEEIIHEARNGRMYILVDDEDRENEGDLIIPAQMATPDAINFMAKHGRGLICLAMTAARIAELKLPPMSASGSDHQGTAFTVSIEARHGVTTGISAADRARTVTTAIDSSCGPEAIVTPGHIFPLAAREGGVLVRAGHTEAAVDVSRLAGLNPSGVICEIMKDDGHMARLDDILAFAETHSLKVGTIRDLIAYRRRHDHLVGFVDEFPLKTMWGGEWNALHFRNRISGIQHIALIKGQILPARPTLVRMHRFNLLTDSLGEVHPREGLIRRAMQTIEKEGAGVLVIIHREIAEPGGRWLQEHIAHGEADDPDMEELREYGIGAQILAELGIHDITLMTSSPHTPIALGGYGLSIVGIRPVD